MSILFIDELPVTKRGRKDNKYSLYLEELKQNPNRWGYLREYKGASKDNAYTFAHNCKRGVIKKLSPQDGVEVVARSAGNGMVIVYARYVGDTNV
jgi:hypothetical protein